MILLCQKVQIKIILKFRKRWEKDALAENAAIERREKGRERKLEDPPVLPLPLSLGRNSHHIRERKRMIEQELCRDDSGEREWRGMSRARLGKWRGNKIWEIEWEMIVSWDVVVMEVPRCCWPLKGTARISLPLSLKQSQEILFFLFGFWEICV